MWLSVEETAAGTKRKTVRALTTSSHTAMYSCDLSVLVSNNIAHLENVRSKFNWVLFILIDLLWCFFNSIEHPLVLLEINLCIYSC